MALPSGRRRAAIVPAVGGGGGGLAFVQAAVGASSASPVTVSFPGTAGLGNIGWGIALSQGVTAAMGSPAGWAPGSLATGNDGGADNQYNIFANTMAGTETAFSAASMAGAPYGGCYCEFSGAGTPVLADIKAGLGSVSGNGNMGIGSFTNGDLLCLLWAQATGMADEIAPTITAVAGMGAITKQASTSFAGAFQVTLGVYTATITATGAATVAISALPADYGGAGLGILVPIQIHT